MGPLSMALYMRPVAADLEHTDVVVIYKGDAGYLIDSEKACSSRRSSNAAAVWLIFTIRCAVRTQPTWRRCSAAQRSTEK